MVPIAAWVNFSQLIVLRMGKLVSVVYIRTKKEHAGVDYDMFVEEGHFAPRAGRERAMSR